MILISILSSLWLAITWRVAIIGSLTFGDLFILELQRVFDSSGKLFYADASLVIRVEAVEDVFYDLLVYFEVIKFWKEFVELIVLNATAFVDVDRF